MAHDLSSVVAGFADEAFGSQAVFRSALQALSHPGRPVSVPHEAELPRQGNAASALLLLALLDADCSLWLSPTLSRSDAALWLRFHTGCRLVDTAAEAQFLWIDGADSLPALHTLRQGSEDYPDQSATCVVDVASLESAGIPADDSISQWTLSGPGIQGSQRLCVAGLPEDFAAQWAGNQAGFPRGVDLFLTTHDQIVGLPRTTRIHTPVEA
jgi:alpha-D-ribose 1-methylphosphonate 5-triphosphate synthase subunit PhnH